MSNETCFTQLLHTIFLQRSRLLSRAFYLHEHDLAVSEHHKVGESRLIAQHYLHHKPPIGLVSLYDVALYRAFRLPFIHICHRL